MREFTDYADFDQTWAAASRNGVEFERIVRRACQTLEFELTGPTFEELADLYQVQVMPLDMDAYWQGG
jgi:hypothetical protein